MFIWIKWFIFTFMIGLIPIIARLMIYFAGTNINILYPFLSSDVVAFGLLLNITMINEILSNESYDTNIIWKNKRIILVGICVVFIFLFTISFGISISDKQNDNFILLNIILVLMSLVNYIKHISSLSRIMGQI